MARRLTTAAAAAILAACASSAPSPTGRTPDAATAPGYPMDPAVLAGFEPTPDGGRRSIDYALIDDALDLIVFNAGPSLRRRERQPEPLVGSRIVRGHTSPYRLEGNKVFFSQFDGEVRDTISQYRSSLERIGASGGVQRLPRDEQLAYWFNLHNVVVIDEIAARYPLTTPRAIRPAGGGATLHEAKIIDLGETRLSLRDVREVVFAHWSDPKVMYGFYLGDIGGPSIRSRAYVGEGIGDVLDRQAREFVNALRGVKRQGGGIGVSAYYEEGRAHFFPAWPGDLKAHLAAYAEAEVSALLTGDPSVRYAAYEDDIADMAGGDVMSDLGFGGSLAPDGSRAAIEGNGADRNGRLPRGMQRMVREYETKLKELSRRGYFKPKIIIIDVPTDDPDEAEEGSTVN